tara:strand:- start:271 stop:738 length:468 start_codon:yes stop_codon:yes gene_type:complete
VGVIFMNRKSNIVLILCILLLLNNCSRLNPFSKKMDTETSEIVNSQISMAVNAFLWRASLDTVSFIPVNTADPIGGFISTDWYLDPENTSERIKLNIYVKDRRLRADAISVTVFREIKISEEWVKADVNPDTSRLVEASILTKARELRIGSLGDS